MAGVVNEYEKVDQAGEAKWCEAFRPVIEKYKTGFSSLRDDRTLCLRAVGQAQAGSPRWVSHAEMPRYRAVYAEGWRSARSTGLASSTADAVEVGAKAPLTVAVPIAAGRRH
jgi:hypothetical protein